ncbi:MAG: hypothetical protein ACR5K5_01140 [Wolbachia sp.]
MDEEGLVFLGVLLTGAPTGLGLSFTALSPLVIGGIVAAVPVILAAAYFMCKEGYSKEYLFKMAVAAASAAAIGVGLAAAATAIFPGAMLGMGSAALTGAAIGVIAPIAGVLAISIPPLAIGFCAASVTGALTGLGLSFTALSPLVIGGIVGSIIPACFAGVLIVKLLYKFFKKDPIEKDDKEAILSRIIVTSASAAIGVGLAAAATPGAMLGMGSAALVGATIGVIAPIAGLATLLAARKVNEHIISPIIEHFSSKGEGYELP